jgi:hypothetical protein
MNGAADADVGPAAADIGEVGVDIGVGRLRVLLQESGGGHDLPGLTITALRHVLGEPGLLHGVPGVRRKAFDGGDGLVGHIANLDAAGPHGLAIDMDGACAALRDAAPEFGASHSELVADDPEQWRFRLDVQRIRLSIDSKIAKLVLLLKPAIYAVAGENKTEICHRIATGPPNCNFSALELQGGVDCLRCLAVIFVEQVAVSFQRDGRRGMA